MTIKRLDRVNELLKQEIAVALFRVMNEKGFDLSAVTITRVITSSNLRAARVMVSVRDHRADRNHILRQLEHHRGQIQELIGKNVILKYTPRLSFELDESIELGDHVLQIISQLEASAPADSGAPVNPQSLPPEEDKKNNDDAL